MDLNKLVERNIFPTTSSSQRLPQNVFFTTTLSQRLSHNVFFQRLSFNVLLTTSFSQPLSHNVVFTPMPQHICPQRHDNLSLCSMLRPPYKYPLKYLKLVYVQTPVISTFFDWLNWNFDVAHLQYIYLFTVWSFRTLGQRLKTKEPRTNCCINISKYIKFVQVQTPVISTFFGQSNWNLNVAHLQYIFFHCGRFQNPRTKASYQNAADKVLYEYPKISQICLSSDPRFFDNFWSIKLKPRRCTSTIYIRSLCEVSEP